MPVSQSHRVPAPAERIHSVFPGHAPSSPQASYRSFRRRRQNSFTSLRLLSPLGPFHRARRGPHLANAGLPRISNAAMPEVSQSSRFQRKEFPIVFGGALPRQKHSQPSCARPRFDQPRRSPQAEGDGKRVVSLVPSNAIPTKWIAFEELSPCIRSRRPASSPG